MQIRKNYLKLEEIAKEYNENKRGFAKAIIYNLIPYFELNIPARIIVKKLKNDFNIEFTTNELYVNKNRYYKPLIANSKPEKELGHNQDTPLQEINKKDSRTDYQKLRDSLDLPNLNSAEEIIRRENEKNEKLKNLLKSKKD